IYLPAFCSRIWNGYRGLVRHRGEFGTSIRFAHGIAGILSNESSFVVSNADKWRYLCMGIRTANRNRAPFSPERRKQLFAWIHDGFRIARLTTFAWVTGIRSPGAQQVDPSWHAFWTSMYPHWRPRRIT